MKSLALLAGIAVLLLGNALASVVSAQHQPAAGRLNGHTRLSALALPHLSHLGVSWPDGNFTEDQAAATGTPTTTTPTPATPSTTATPVTTGTVTPSPSPTTSPYPDPVGILNNGFQKYSLIRTSHFELITNGVITGQEKLVIDATGDATCSGPAFKTHVKATDTLEGTSQSRKVNSNFVVIKNKAWVKKSGKNQKWKTTKAANVGAFSFPVDNPLICPSASSGSGSGSGSSNNTQLKDVVNLGPETFQGVKMWHIRATEVSVDSTGKTQDATIDFLFSQGTYLPYVFTVSVADPTQNLTLSQKQILTKFGEKVKISKPKIGK